MSIFSDILESDCEFFIYSIITITDFLFFLSNYESLHHLVTKICCWSSQLSLLGFCLLPFGNCLLVLLWGILNPSPALFTRTLGSTVCSVATLGALVPPPAPAIALPTLVFATVHPVIITMVVLPATSGCGLPEKRCGCWMPLNSMAMATGRTSAVTLRQRLLMVSGWTCLKSLVTLCSLKPFLCYFITILFLAMAYALAF